MGIVNIELMKNPVNWVIVTLMVLIAAFAFNLIMQYQTTP